MAPATATLTPSPAVVPAASPAAALTLANVLYEKKGAIAYVTLNRPKAMSLVVNSGPPNHWFGSGPG